MHLVFVSELLPAGPPRGVSGIADWAVVDGLRRIGARVSWFGFKQPDAALAEPREMVCLGEIGTAANAAQRLRWRAAALASGMPVACVRLRAVAEEKVRNALTGLEPVDGLVLNGATLAGAFENVLTARPHIFIVLDAEPAAARQDARETRALAALEKRLREGARFVLTQSDLPLVMPQAPEPSGERTPAFDIGLSGDWASDIDRAGLEWFLQSVVPKLHPDAMIAIAGPVARGIQGREKRVMFLGPVMDEREFLRQCRVVALPARQGAGLPLQTVQTLELGLPAVATPAALRGIADAPDNARRADDPEAFAAALQELVVAQRTGMLPDADGAAFRAARQARMEEILADALARLAETPVGS
jgi:hypothetical protein